MRIYEQMVKLYYGSVQQRVLNMFQTLDKKN